MNTSKYILHELFDPTDNRHWRLHWFEELTMNQQTTEPLIEALFVPLVRTDLDLDRNPPELLNNDSYDGRCRDAGGIYRAKPKVLLIARRNLSIRLSRIAITVII
jgi:hypothetical protein